MTRRSDEIAMMLTAVATGCLRDADGNLIDASKRERRILEKWIGRGWWDCGVSVRSGWVTDKGREEMAAALLSAAKEQACVTL